MQQVIPTSWLRVLPRDVLKNPSVLAYWTVFCVLGGVLLAPLVTPTQPSEAQSSQYQIVDHSQHLNHDHMHHGGEVALEGGVVPSVKLRVTKDHHAGWNLELDVTNFEFVLPSLDQPDQMGVGHAHIYVDGEKLGRLYGTRYHLGDLASGRHVVKVTLNANSHASFVHNGQEIAAEVEIMQP